MAERLDPNPVEELRDVARGFEGSNGTCTLSPYHALIFERAYKGHSRRADFNRDPDGNEYPDPRPLGGGGLEVSCRQLFAVAFSASPTDEGVSGTTPVGDADEADADLDARRTTKELGPQHTGTMGTTRPHREEDPPHLREQIQEAKDEREAEEAKKREKADRDAARSGGRSTLPNPPHTQSVEEPHRPAPKKSDK